MFDYSNIPVMTWDENAVPLKAKAQILHQEPVILQMPSSFRISLEASDFGCKLDPESGILTNCDGGKLLRQAAKQSNLDGLKVVADACEQSRSRADLDQKKLRIIIHD